MHKFFQFPKRQQLDIELAQQVAKLLKDAIKVKGQATIAVSGGSTPKGFFAALSQQELDWQQVTVCLVDERCLDQTNSDSNTYLVKQQLLNNCAANAQFFDINPIHKINSQVNITANIIPNIKKSNKLEQADLTNLNDLVQNKLSCFDVLILGMGEDGHTASIFPCSKQLDDCFAADAPPLVAVQPTTANYQRISFSFPYLKQSKAIFLHIVGEKKLATLTSALANSDHLQMPISAFLHHQQLQTQVYWAK